MDRLRGLRNRSSMHKNYYCVWNIFNEFIVKLDRKPHNWEGRLTLFIAYLINQRKKSTTIRSYISAIRSILLENRIKICEDAFFLSSLTKACKLINDHAHTRLPIWIDLLHLLIKKIDGYFDKQPYLNKLYEAIFISGYFGLLRIGELTESEHVIRAQDVQIGQNKDKILFVLHSSKTHDEGSKPQFVKITGLSDSSCATSTSSLHRVCPFRIIHNFITVRLSAKSIHEQFFVF